jgi:hydroxyacylglutathione hydrolase
MAMQFVFEQIRVGGDRNFGYLLGDRLAKQAVLIDPSYSPGAVVQRAIEQHLKVTHVINTHGHPDHINGNAEALKLTGAPLAAHPDCPSFPDVKLGHNAELAIGALKLRFFHTPGHCEDHLVIYESTHHVLISGDLLFVGKVGGTKTEADARIDWDSLQLVLNTLPEATTVWPGHDYGVRPSTTLALEKASNPFLLCRDVDAFLKLKMEWPNFKKEHGLK